jgi:non-specific serine/threonine protein kinase
MQLLRLLGKSARTMAWLAADPTSGRDVMLVLPRQQPADAQRMEHWQQVMRQASRLAHPEVAAVLETGVQDGWPYACYEIASSATLSDRLTSKGLPGPEAAALCVQLLRGLAYAHDAGVAHHDLQPCMLMVNDDGTLRLAGLGVGCTSGDAADPPAAPAAPREAGASLASGLPEHRLAAERDVLAAGLMLHAVLAGRPALDEPDIGRAIAAMPPLGRDIVRLPWTLPRPVADALRAIVNRATDRQERQRYRSARTLLRALEGWLQSDDAAGGGPLALLTDKLRNAGVLPTAPGAAGRRARLAAMERERTNALADVVLDDPAMCFELLRMANAAQLRGGMVGGSGPVLTVRRAIALLGEQGLQRAGAALRPWPGPLAPPAAAELAAAIERCQRAARAAVELRPPGYDGEVVYLVAMLQNLGRLVLLYHFPDEAQQIRKLMQPVASQDPDERDEPGMAEDAASFAVLGADTEALGAAVARQWGLGDAAAAMARRLPPSGSVRAPESDEDMLRTVANCANEASDALQLPAQRVLPALQRVVQRHARALGIDLRDLQAAFQPRPRQPIAQTVQAPLDGPVAVPARQTAAGVAGRAATAGSAALRALAAKRAAQ